MRSRFVWIRVGVFCCVSLPFLLIPAQAFSQTFINYESSQVHPIDVSPDGNTLAVCNTADNRIQIFDISSGVPVRPLPPLIDHVQVGIDPVSVRFLSNTELWAVNVISDTISVIDLTTGLVRQTIQTLDEPADVIFAGSPLKAFVTCSAVDTVQVFDATNPALGPLASIAIDGEDPRALAVNPTGTRVFVAIFESGNHSTILSGNLINPAPPIFPNAVGSPNSPYAGSPNPPPNNGASFFPPKNPALPDPPGVSLIVKKNVGTGQWMDDNGRDWSSIVDGVHSMDSGRVFGWDMLDNDVAVIDTSTLAVTNYAEGMMNICMAIAFNPATGSITVVGIDATNEVRFEPNITGTFIRDNLATFVDGAPGTVTVNDMNVTHLDAAQGGAGLAYMDGDVPQAERDKSIGDPRGVVWMASGRGYVSGMGSNNVLPLTNASTRTSTGATIDVGEGPTGLALNPAQTHLYVLNKFASSISTIDTATDAVINTINFFDPSPQAIKAGRKHFYNTHKNSGLGHIACASCHIDGKMDRLAWDLGNPSGAMDPVTLATHNMGMGILGLAPASPPLFASPDPNWEDSHPMKGPMTTQTFQDIIGKEPFHWRGDRQGLESFNPAFVGLNGDDVELTPTEMQEFEDFVATFYFPPNPFRNLDNSLPTSVPLAGQFSTGRFSGSGGLNRGDPMPPGNPQRGLRLYMGTEAPNFNMDAQLNCVTCHSLPVGNGADSVLRANNSGYDQFPVGMLLGNHHIGMVSTDTAKNIAIKTPQLRNPLDKAGYSNAVTPSRAGFGFFHDGSIDSVTTFLSSPVFNQLNDQDIADLVALMFAFSGSDFGNPPQNPPVLFFNGAALVPLVSEPLSMQFSKDTHAAVGQQQTINTPGASLVLINQFIDLSDDVVVDLIVKGSVGGSPRGWYHTSGRSTGIPMFQSDRAGETIDLTTLLALASAGSELTFTVVHEGSGERLGVDRDGDLNFDFDELTLGSDPADPDSVPKSTLSVSPLTLSSTIEVGEVAPAQLFTVRNSGIGTTRYTITDDAPWMSIFPTSGMSMGETDSISVNYDTATLTPGVYTGLITISDPGAENSPQTILVTLTVNEIPNNAPHAFAQMVTMVRNTEAQITLTGDDGELPPTQALTFILSALPINGTVSLTSGGLAIADPLPLALSGPTLYYVPDTNFIGRDVFRFQVMDDGGTANGGFDLSAEATVAIEIGDPLLSVNPSTLSATIEEREVTPDQTFTVRNSGIGTVRYTITVDAPWMSIIPTFGTSTGETESIGVHFATLSLSPGVYTGFITVSDPGALNSPQTIQVTLTVTGEATATTDTGSSGGGGCFIATATYGTPLAQEIEALREVRDTYLLNNAAGAAFVDAYYTFSPPLADFVARHPAAAAATRILLTPIIALAHVLWMFPLLVGVVLLAAAGYVARRRKYARSEICI